MGAKYKYLITTLGCTRSYTRREASSYEGTGCRQRYSGKIYWKGFNCAFIATGNFDRKDSGRYEAHTISISLCPSFNCDFLLVPHTTANFSFSTKPVYSRLWRIERQASKPVRTYISSDISSFYSNKSPYLFSTSPPYDKSSAVSILIYIIPYLHSLCTPTPWTLPPHL